MCHSGKREALEKTPLISPVAFKFLIPRTSGYKNIDETAYLFGVTIVAEAFPFSRAPSFRTREVQEFVASE
jgi:hypothetical protein